MYFEAAHPDPGRAYDGSIMKAFFKDNADSDDVIRLLKKAFDSRVLVTLSPLGKLTWNVNIKNYP